MSVVAELEARETRTKEQPSLKDSREVSILRRSQKGFRVETKKFTSMKSKKTDSVSTDSTKRTLGLTPRFSPFPSVLDLPNGERISSTG